MTSADRRDRQPASSKVSWAVRRRRECSAPPPFAVIGHIARDTYHVLSWPLGTCYAVFDSSNDYGLLADIIENSHWRQKYLTEEWSRGVSDEWTPYGMEVENIGCEWLIAYMSYQATQAFLPHLEYIHDTCNIFNFELHSCNLFCVAISLGQYSARSAEASIHAL